MTFEEFIEEEKARDPEFRRDWEEHEPEFQIIRMLVGTRSRRGWTQKQLAKRMGIDPGAVADAEMTGKVTPEFLARFAAAAGGEVMLSIRVPGQHRLAVRLRPAAEHESTPFEYSLVPPEPAPQRRRVTFRLANRRQHPAAQIAASRPT